MDLKGALSCGSTLITFLNVFRVYYYIKFNTNHEIMYIVHVLTDKF